MYNKKTSHIYLWLSIALVALSASEAYHVLLVFPLPSKSHSILGQGFASTLLDAGHEVTFITPYHFKTNNSKYHEVLVDENDALMKVHETMSIEGIMKKEVNIDGKDLFLMLEKIHIVNRENPKIIKFLNSDAKFDVVIVEWMFSEVNIGYAAVFDCPFIYFGTTDPHGMTLRLIDENTSPTVLSGIISSNVPPLSFFNRVYELGMQIFFDFFKEVVMYRKDKVHYETAFAPYVEKRGRTLPAYDEFRHSAALMLGNSHVSLGTSHRLPQSYKPIGGYHIKAHITPLPENLKKIMDSAKDGVIYFSMGSNLSGKDLPQSVKKELLELFGTLKYTVLWKFEEDLPNRPKNVHILKWAPQPAILGHPNCILFITHGGLLSTTEAIHYGVPTIGIPVFGDQPTNVRKAVNKGYALKVDLSYTMAKELKDAIIEITTNPKYTKRVKELSLIYHDRPVPPAKELVHWVEHVVKTNGAPHLRSPALMVPWYQKMYLDVLALLIIVILVLVKIVKIVFSAIFPGNKIKSSKKNN